jgi:serine/threonine-protein kinase RsbW
MREASTLKLSSHPRSVEKITNFVDTLANKFRLAPDTHGDILLSLTEAVTNAIVHGNKQDESKFVEVCTKSNGSKLAITVKDEGRGFDYKNLPDPTSPERICECGGRGVFLMRQLADKCRFTDNGRVVEMEFKLGAVC